MDTYMKNNKCPVAFVTTALILCLLCLYAIFSPSNHWWFPKCWFYQLTGLQCPACGNQRALHSLLQGKFAAAFSYNPFFFISIPYFCSVAYVCWFDTIWTRKIKPFITHKIVVNIYLSMVIIWWLLRNTIPSVTAEIFYPL